MMARGELQSLLEGFTNMTRHHGYTFYDVLDMIPFEYQLMRMMITAKIEEENKALEEARKQQR